MKATTKELSGGKIAALKRARHLTEFEWIPLKDVPTYSKKNGKVFLEAGKPLKGIPYSSMERTDKFIVENVSFETFLSIINNPDSALYTKDLGGGTTGKQWTYFGLVCNSLVRYAFGIKERINTNCWFQIPGMRLIAKEGQYAAEQIEICDVLYAYGNGRNHVALITNLEYDKNGKVTRIEVSEAVSPLCKREWFDTGVFFEKYKLFSLTRYDYVDSVPDNDDSVDELLFNRSLESALPHIAVDCGNKSNYTVGEEITISVFSETEDVVEIRRGDVLVENVTVKGGEKIKRRLERGYYTAKNLTYGEMVEFCFKEPNITHTLKDGCIEITADPCDSESTLSHMDFRGKGEDVAGLVKTECFTDEEKETGIIRKPIPDGAFTYKINFVNKYGMWTHRIKQI